MKPLLAGAILGLVAFTFWMLANSPKTTLAIFSDRHIPAAYR